MSKVRVKWIVTFFGGQSIEIRATSQREACRLARELVPIGRILGCRRA